MDIKRFFSTAQAKGLRNYIDSQKKYEILRTIFYFAISLSLFIAGLVATGSRNNLLTIVAVLGCLPASKSLVEAVMYCRYHSLKSEEADAIERHTEGLICLYDMIFTTREKTYPVLHLTICGNTVVGYLPDTKCPAADGAKHLETGLKTDRYTSATVKLFSDINKYQERVAQLKELAEGQQALSEGIAATLKSIAL